MSAAASRGLGRILLISGCAIAFVIAPHIAFGGAAAGTLAWLALQLS